MSERLFVDPADVILHVGTAMIVLGLETDSEGQSMLALAVTMALYGAASPDDRSSLSLYEFLVGLQADGNAMAENAGESSLAKMKRVYDAYLADIAELVQKGELAGGD